MQKIKKGLYQWQGKSKKKKANHRSCDYDITDLFYKNLTDITLETRQSV